MKRGLALALTALAACSGLDAPNDPVVALYCDDGYVLNPEGTGCIAEQSLLVHGVVRHAITGAFISDVSAVVHPPGATLATDANGYFALQGAPTTDNVIVIYSHPAFAARTATFSQTELGVGMTVIDASIDLAPLPDVTPIGGTIYAGDGPAVGATVVLRDTLLAHDAYESTTTAGGAFTFPAVAYGSYSLRVRPFDEDGDGITDYRFTELALGNIAETTAFNVTNLVVALAPVSRSILYTNLVGLVTPFSGPIGVHPTLLRLAGPNDNLVFHLGAGVDTSSVVVSLLPFEVGNGGASGTGEPLPMTAAWSGSDTVLTIDPAASLVADAFADTQYELRIHSLVWDDGQVFVSPTSPTVYLAFRFDVSTAPTLPGSPTPQIYLANKVTASQTATGVQCDARVCWLTDANGFFFGGFADPVLGTTISSGFNAGNGFQLWWTHVPGAASYWMYARQRNDNGTSLGFSDWYSLGRATVDSATSPTDPELGPVVFVDNVLQLTAGARNDWIDFDRTGGGPLAFDNEIDIAITAIDGTGYESPITSANAITFADDQPASLRSATLDYSGAGAQAATTELGTSVVSKVLRLSFSEYMDAAVAPQLAVTSGNIVGLGAPAARSWDVVEPLTPQNVSDDVALGPMALRLRGACTVVTCRASFNAAEPGLSDDAVCVQDVALFATGDVFFISAAGTLLHGELTLASVSAQTNRLIFSAPVTATIDPGAFACAVSPTPANTYGTTLTVAPAAAATTINVADAALFHSGEIIVLYDTAGNDFITRTIAGVTTGAAQQLQLTAAVGSGALAAGTTAVMRAPAASEYVLRPVTNPTLRFDSLAAASMQLDFTSSLTASSVMEGDLVLIDLDGNLVTAGDRTFGVVTDVSMVLDAASVGVDESDFHLVVTSVAGLPFPPAGSTVLHAVSQIYTLGDSFTITNSDPAGPTSMVDTSNNRGLNSYRDQVSACVGPVPPTCTGGVFIY
jgi:hypothetical protein